MSDDTVSKRPVVSVFHVFQIVGIICFGTTAVGFPGQVGGICAGFLAAWVPLHIGAIIRMKQLIRNRDHQP